MIEKVQKNSVSFFNLRLLSGAVAVCYTRAAAIFNYQRLISIAIAAANLLITLININTHPLP
jgi:hypothetical protein